MLRRAICPFGVKDRIRSDEKSAKRILHRTKQYDLQPCRLQRAKERGKRMSENTKQQHKLYTLLFAGIGAFCCLLFYLNGKSLLWKEDAIGQYYPVFLYIGQYLRNFLGGLLHGEWVLPAYDLSIAMGEDIAGCLNYYGFGDPINLIAVFATKKDGSLVYSISYFLRVYLAGRAFLYYCDVMHMGGIPKRVEAGGCGGKAAGKLRPFWRTSDLGAAAYAFCGFSLYGGMRYVEWLCVMIYFPLLLAGAEKLLRDRREIFGFTLSVCCGGLCGFYYLYMSTLAGIVYCIVRLCAAEGKLLSFRGMKKILRLVPCYFLGLCLSAPILLPATSEFLHSQRNSQAWEVVTDPANYIPKLWRLRVFLRTSLLPVGSAGLETGILIAEWITVAVVVLRGRKRRERQLCLGILLTVIAVSIPITGYLFNAFGETNERWYYLVHFLAAVILVCELEDGLLQRVVNSDIGRWIAAALIAGNIIFNIVYIYGGIGIHWIEDFVPQEDVQIYTASPVAESVAAADSDLMRVSMDQITDINGRPDNTAMINGCNGVNYWFSMVNQSTQDYVDWSAGSKMDWRSYGFGHNAYTEAAVGCKYLFTRESDPDKEEYQLAEKISFGGETWYVYENLLFRGMVYECGEADSFDESTGISLEEYYKDIFSELSAESIRNVVYNDVNGQLNYTVEHAESSNVVMAIPYSSSWRVYVDGKRCSGFQWNNCLAARIPAGTHEVSVRYCPVALALGILLMAISLAALCGSALFQRVWKRTHAVRQ